ncbi:hypothetical protein RUM43_005949 [Polyplax serrata]|uniref:aralkylamine N-acetyltransferase n=1 Tax=Polyplax serrata TaxID=468196 RepID=A0AAN8PKC4_POLSC
MGLFFRTLIRQLHTSNIIITKATDRDRKEILRLMQDIFYKTDPSSVYTKVSEVPKISSQLQEMTVESLDDNLSFVAKEKGDEKTILGVAINGIRPAVIRTSGREALLKQVKSKRERTLLELWEFVSSMPSDGERYFGDESVVFEVQYLVVDPLHRNKGIATSLVSQSRKEAAARGHRYIRIDCTSHFTARIASSMGLNCIYEIDYQDYKNPSGEHVFTNVMFPHTKILVYAGKTAP